MLVPMRYGPDIEAGRVTLIFRRWKKRGVVVGNTYRTAAGRLVVTSIKVVAEDKITKADAKRAGYSDPEAVRQDLRGGADQPIYRIGITAATDPDPRAALQANSKLTKTDVDELDMRLERLDRASSWGTWTMDTMRIIQAQPATLAADLAAQFGRTRDPFKLDVRKLKNLGLTHSLAVGYELSPRGKAYLKKTKR